MRQLIHSIIGVIFLFASGLSPDAGDIPPQ